MGTEKMEHPKKLKRDRSWLNDNKNHNINEHDNKDWYMINFDIYLYLRVQRVLLYLYNIFNHREIEGTLIMNYVGVAQSRLEEGRFMYQTNSTGIIGLRCSHDGCMGRRYIYLREWLFFNCKCR